MAQLNSSIYGALVSNGAIAVLEYIAAFFTGKVIRKEFPQIKQIYLEAGTHPKKQRINSCI